jgi:hypothetical protein
MSAHMPVTTPNSREAYRLRLIKQNKKLKQNYATTGGASWLLDLVSVSLVFDTPAQLKAPTGVFEGC